MSAQAQVSEPPTFSNIQTEVREYGGLPYRKPESFMDLPWEVRNMIYHILLQPDAAEYSPCPNPRRNADGCTTVLCLNRKIRAEAVRVFERLTPLLEFDGRGGITRQFFGYPTPTLFHSLLEPMSKYRKTRIMPELAFLRVRKVTVDFTYPARIYRDDDGTEVFDEWQLKRMSGLQRLLHGLQKAVLKSKSLVELHFRIQIDAYPSEVRTEDGSKPSRYTIELNDDNSKLFALFNPLLNAARGQAFRITAKEKAENYQWPNTDGSPSIIHVINYHDPLVEYINNAVLAAAGDPPPQEELSSVVPVNADGEVRCEGHPSAAVATASDRINYPELDYEITPECRKCYETFRDKADLALHLQQRPKHRLPFTKTEPSGWWLSEKTKLKMKCRVCGKSFDRDITLRAHCRKAKHFRTREQGNVWKWK